MTVSYIAAGDGQVQELRGTVSHHLLKGLHIQTKVLYIKNTKDMLTCENLTFIFVLSVEQKFCFGLKKHLD